MSLKYTFYISQDVQWGDIDYMYKKQIFTVDKQTYSGLNTFVNDLHDAHMKYIVIVVSKI